MSRSRSKTGVYQIRNHMNNKCYIGSAASRSGFLGRWNKHILQLNKGDHHSIYLQRAWDKHSADSFVFKILLHCDPEHCLMYEQILLDQGYGEYNVSRAANCPMGGRQHSNESKLKMRKAKLGCKLSVETKQKISIAQRGELGNHYGRPIPEKIKRKISQSLFGERNPKAKLTVDNVLQIRLLLKRGWAYTALAHKFNITKGMIGHIKHRRNWSHV